MSTLVYLSGCAPYSLPKEKTYPVKEAALTLYTQSQDLYQSAEYVPALKLIDSALAINQHFAQFYQLKGDILRKVGQDDSALTAYTTAIQQRSNYIEVYISIADIYHQHTHYHESIRYLRKAMAVDSTLTPLYFAITDNYIALQEWEVGLNTLDDYRKRSQLLNQPIAEDYYRLKGKILYNQKHFTTAIQELLQCQPEKTSNQEVLALLGRSYYSLNDYESGLRYFNKLIRLDVQGGEWYYYRGIYFFRKNNMEDARNQFEMALNFDSTLYTCHYYIGKIYELKGDTQRAIEELRLYRESMRTIEGLGIEQDELRELKSYNENQ